MRCTGVAPDTFAFASEREQSEEHMFRTVGLLAEVRSALYTYGGEENVASSTNVKKYSSETLIGKQRCSMNVVRFIIALREFCSQARCSAS